jgi:hypothetical protein
MLRRSIRLLFATIAICGFVRVQGQVQPDTSNSTSFETAPAGQFDELETTIGTWTSVDGRTITDDKHAKTRRQCLQLTGGEKTSVTLQIAGGMERSGYLTFWAERWTSRSPFSFRIDRHNGKDWKAILKGADTNKDTFMDLVEFTVHAEAKLKLSKTGR